MGFPGGSDSKESACNAGDPTSIPGSGRSPGKGNGHPLQYSFLDNSMDRALSLVGYSPWGRKQSYTTLTIKLFYVICGISKRLYSLKCSDVVILAREKSLSSVSIYDIIQSFLPCNNFVTILVCTT